MSVCTLDNPLKIHYTTNITTKHGDNMKVYVGQLRYIYDGETELVVATTKERMEKELVKLAEQYVEYLDEDERNSLDKANSFDDWNDIGCNNEWFELLWTRCEVKSDEHILKHAMETI